MQMGKTALHEAVEYHQNESTIRLLLKKADANIQDNDGKTALHEAVSYERNEDTVRILLEKSDSNILDHDGFTALGRAGLDGYDYATLDQILRRQNDRHDNDGGAESWTNEAADEQASIFASWD